jgi:hypothetical protein
MKVIIKKSTKKDKKLMAIFTGPNFKKTTHFGAAGYSDYTTHRDPERKQRYLNRHRKNETWNDPMTAGSLSRWILWNKTSLKESITDYRRRFKLT